MVYKCMVHPWVLKLCSLALAGVSFMVVWSEATIGTGRSPDLSPFSLVSRPFTVAGGPRLRHTLSPQLCFVCLRMQQAF